MQGEKILMSQRELQRFKVMSFAEAGKITLKEAGEKMGVSYRQAKRTRQAIRGEGVKGLIHGNRAKQRSPVKGAKSYDWIYQASSTYGLRSGRVIIFDPPATWRSL